MATKIFNARLQNKYDSYQEWYDANPVLLAGEPCFVVVPAETGEVNQEPAVLIKVGDGTTAWRDLPYVSAKAADVADWAMASTKPVYKANEIEGLADYISGEIQDTNTQYKIEQDAEDAHVLHLYSKEVNGEWVLDKSITTADTVYDDTALAGRVTALEEKVGEKAVGTQITEAIDALKLGETYELKGAKDEAIAAAQKAADDAQAAIDAHIEAVGEIEAGAQVNKIEVVKVNGEALEITDKAVDITVPTGTLAGKDIVSEAELDEALKAKINSTADADAVAALTERVEANEGAIETLNANAETEGSVDYKIAQAVAAIMENPDETMNSINELVTWVNDHADDALALSNQVSTNKDDIADLKTQVGEGTVEEQIAAAIEAALKAEGADKYALAADLTAAIERIVALEAAKHTHKNLELLETYTQTEADLADAVAKKHAHENADVLAGISAEKVAAWDAAQTNAEKTASDALNAAVETINEEIAKKANDDDLAAVAKTGSVNDLVQEESDYFILYCGDATTLTDAPVAE